jgi:hypothetical protein
MDALKLDSLSEFLALISEVEFYEPYSAKRREIHISGPLYHELHRTYLAFEKYKIPKTTGKIAIGGALLGIVTGGLGLIPAGIIFAAGTVAAILAVRACRTNPYASEVYCLYQNKFKLVRNSDNVIVLCSP